MGCDRRCRRRARRPARRCAYPGRRLAADLLHQPAGRGCPCRRRLQRRPRRRGEAALERPRHPRGCARHRQRCHDRLRDHSGRQASAGSQGRRLASVGLGVVGLAAFAICERRTAEPLLRIERLRDRAVGGGLALFLANSGLMFGMFLLCSVYLQARARTWPASRPGSRSSLWRSSAGMGAGVAGHLINRHGLRWVTGPALALAAGGLLLLSHVPAHGSYLRDMLPGMLMAGFGLGLSGTAMSVGVLTGARGDEAGMLSGASATGHEIGGTLGIAIYASIATAASWRRLRRPRSRSRDRARVPDRGIRRGRHQHRCRRCSAGREDVPAEAAAQPAADRRPLRPKRGHRHTTSRCPHPTTNSKNDTPKGDIEMTAMEMTIPAPAQRRRFAKIAAMAAFVTAVVLGSRRNGGGRSKRRAGQRRLLQLAD